MAGKVDVVDADNTVVRFTVASPILSGGVADIPAVFLPWSYQLTLLVTAGHSVPPIMAQDNGAPLDGDFDYCRVATSRFLSTYETTS